MRQDYQPKDKWTVDNPDLLKAALGATHPRHTRKKGRWVVLALLLIILIALGAWFAEQKSTSANSNEITKPKSQVVHIPLTVPGQKQ